MEAVGLPSLPSAEWRKRDGRLHARCNRERWHIAPRDLDTTRVDGGFIEVGFSRPLVTCWRREPVR